MDETVQQLWKIWRWTKYSLHLEGFYKTVEETKMEVVWILAMRQTMMNPILGSEPGFIEKPPQVGREEQVFPRGKRTPWQRRWQPTVGEWLKAG